jgi:hypothetical protein
VPEKEVKQERTGWRDLALSARHRLWGWDCPAVDIDFLMIEYDNGSPIALVEYKNECAPTQYSNHPSYRAMIELGTCSKIPVLAVRYKSDFSTFTVVPLNKFAKDLLPGAERKDMTEYEYVTFLYRIRGRKLPKHIFADQLVEI